MSNYFNCLLIGDYGTGKTTSSATAPSPVLFLDIDNKLHRMENMQENLKSGRVIQWAVDEQISTFGLVRLVTMDPKPGRKITVQRPKGYLALAEMIEKLVKDKCVVNGKKIETVVLDSYTSVDEHIRRLLMAVNGTNTMTQPLYGALLTNFEDLNSTLLRLPANIIFICHEQVIRDELTGKVSYRPLINGSMHNKIGKDFEEVYATIKTVRGDKATYEMLTLGDGMRSCRTSRKLPPKAEPNFTKLYEKGGK